jgi:FAD synthetase
VAFNGGKDCIVTLHLVHAFLRNEGRVPLDKKMRVLLIEDEQPFDEVTEFVEASKEIYNFEILKVPRPMKEGLQQILSDHPEVKASVLGTRSGDPKAANQEAFSPTDPGWPVLMRVNPILKWTYGDIWSFIRGLYLVNLNYGVNNMLKPLIFNMFQPYPSLYDRGYTSLGDKRNTLPNPSLAVTDSDGNVVYKPAFSLQDDSLERTGRN